MKALTLVTVALAFSAQAQASDLTKRITCSFTEPFQTVEVDLVKRQVTLTEPAWETDPAREVTRVIAEGIKIQISKADPFFPQYKVLNKKGEVVLKLALSGGSDGMSDIVFPFAAEYMNNQGGCSSDRIKEHNPYEQR